MFKTITLLLFLFPVFVCKGQEYNALVFSEIMADPLPVAGLPDAEYLEIYNRSDKTISLKGWKLITGTRSVLLPDSTVSPGSYLLICHRNNAATLAVYGKVVGLSSFSLTNEGMSIGLYNLHNRLIYAISYLSKWWPADKKDGGYSLEMTDIQNPCGEADNWAVTADPKGGTPGRKNSIKKKVENLVPPVIERADVLDNGETLVVFNKRMDSLNLVAGATIELTGRKISKRQAELALFHNLRLTPDLPLLKNQQYELTIRNAADCAGNLLRETVLQIGLPSPADSGDVVINEVLFNPRGSGADFIELYNKSSKFINLKNWAIGNVKTDETNDFNLITTSDLLISPNAYLAITTDVNLVKENYPADKEGHFFETASLLSLPNKEGGVVLRSSGSLIFDRFMYFEKMHHELLSDYEGVSLEKANPEISSAVTSNWKSSSSTSGYATPGYVNSQAEPETDEDYFNIKPDIFTPDNDGHDDYATIEYKQNVSAALGTIRIFSVSGRLVKSLLRNQIIGTNGEIRWDGNDENGQPVSTGYYLVLINCFDTSGKTWQYKKRIVVARKNG